MNISREAKQALENSFGKTGNSVYNDDIRLHLAEKVQHWFSSAEKYGEMVNLEKFVETFKSWILSSKLNIVAGLETFPFCHFSSGVTQALDEFHFEILKNRLRLRTFRGEYPYNRDVCPFSYELGFIDDHPLQKGDAVILSCPFSASGDVHPKMKETLDECYKLGIPVFMDLAWFGTCGGLEVDLSHPAITYVAFSLTKGLTCGNYRSGIRFSRPNFEKQDRLSLQHSWNHSLHLNAKIGIELMENFSPDIQFEKYRLIQENICSLFNLSPSSCVHIATSSDRQWMGYDRDGFCNRINLKDAIKFYIKNFK